MLHDQQRKRIAVIGGGIAGVSAAYYLGKVHDVVLYEGESRLGGHTHTIEVDDPYAGRTPVDTGFIVCNDRTYPNFHNFLKELRVPVRAADMSFGFYDVNAGFGYAPTGISGVIPKLSALWNRQYLNMWRTLPWFNRVARADLESGALSGLTLGEYLQERGVHQDFVSLFLVPMGGAIWSSGDVELLEYPAESFLHFFRNHGLLSLFDRPQWQTVVGGSYQYLKAFSSQFSGEVRLGARVKSIERMTRPAVLTDSHGREEYDLLVVALHADLVLPLLAEPSEGEKRLFSEWRYHANETVLHTDISYLPPSKKIWASWNYRRERGESGKEPLSVTYHMNRLQGLRTKEEYCVTLNPRTKITPGKVVREILYHHPVFTEASVRTQGEIRALGGENATYFVGSYLGWGFHEDAILSSVQVVEQILGVHPTKIAR